MASVMNGDEREGWVSYAAEQERHAETVARLDLMTREARLSRDSTEKAVQREKRLRERIAYLTDRERIEQAIYDVAVDHPMWIGDDGRGLDYLPEREARIGDFVCEAAASVLTSTPSADAE